MKYQIYLQLTRPEVFMLGSILASDKQVVKGKSGPDENGNSIVLEFMSRL